jgi:hypothetical protein
LRPSWLSFPRHYLSLEEPRPTLLVDEADAIFTKKRKGDADTEGLRAVFNAGNRRGVTVGRVEMQGKRRKLERLEVFGTKAIAGIGELPPTITDRSIVIRMRRKSRAERVRRFRYRRVQAEAARIAQPDWDAVSLVPDVPHVPEAMSDRAQDMWEPLLAVADAAAGTWPARARQAAVVLAAEKEQRPTLGVQLLIDVRDPLSINGHLTPTALADVLAEMDESPWADYYGKPITAKAIANLLAPYGISSREARVEGDKHRYYFASDFEDAWSRYLVGPDLSGTSETTGTAGFAQATAQGTAIVEIEQDYPASAWEVA